MAGLCEGGNEPSGSLKATGQIVWRNLLKANVFVFRIWRLRRGWPTISREREREMEDVKYKSGRCFKYMYSVNTDENWIRTLSIQNPFKLLKEAGRVEAEYVKLRLGLMKNFVKALDTDSDTFWYLCNKFPELSYAKMKEGVFKGPQMRKTIADSHFQDLQDGTELLLL
ncbi:hypothetical protein ANN_12120 [Periplaneta americana]|uniref:Uncharacterized protein n=1 Tax=Periplaneta americana TaxID=6978 RepID=A0ABQ8T6Y8_PERAM|nr:hypothetical protein ANN_12120 [Periplaneta americana]